MEKRNKSWIQKLYLYIRIIGVACPMIFTLYHLTLGKLPILYPVGVLTTEYLSDYLKSFGIANSIYRYPAVISLGMVFLFVVLLLRLIERKPLLKMSMGMILLTALVLCCVFKVPVSKILLAGCFLYIYDAVTGLLYTGKSLSFVPFMILAIWISLAVPVSAKPINWQWAVNAVDHWQSFIYSQISQMRLDDKKDAFSLDMLGFSTENRDSFFGSVFGKSPAILLRVSSGSKKRGDGYLMGTIRDVYTGRSFIQDDDTSWRKIDEYKMNYYEILYNLYYTKLASDRHIRFCKKMEYLIEYDAIRTSSVFYPQNSYYINMNNEDEINTGNLLNLELKSSNKPKEYDTLALRINDKHPGLIEYLKSVDQVRYPLTLPDRPINTNDLAGAEANLMFMECFTLSQKAGVAAAFITSDDFTEYLVKRRDKIRQVDLKLPNSVPDRVYQLADEITRNETTQYDKAIAIRDYLKKLEYSKRVGPSKENADFVDDFLFEQKKGYCVHFASAMTVLCRCEGIPARYVEGLIVNFREKKDGRYLVKNSGAHSWCEIYLEGFGWVRMEATPGYGRTIKSDWDKVDPVAKSRQKEIEEFYRSKMVSAMSSKRQEWEEKEKIRREKSRNRSILVIACILTVCAVVIALIRHRKYVLSITAKGKVVFCFKRILLYLKYSGYKMERNETISEYMDRLSVEAEWMEEDFITFFERYEQIRYSGCETTGEDILYANAIEKRISKACMKQMGKVKFAMIWLLKEYKY